MNVILSSAIVAAICSTAMLKIGRYSVPNQEGAARAARLYELACCSVAVTCAAALAYNGQPSFTTALLISMALVCAYTDIRSGIICNRVVGIAALGFFVAAIAKHTLERSLAGAVIVGAAFYLLWAVTRGRGIGGGDVKYAVALGAALGLQAGLAAAGIAFVLGGAVAVALLLLKRANRGTQMKFAPYLACGSIVALWEFGALS